MRRIAILSALMTLMFSIMAVIATPLLANPDFDLGPPVNAKAPDIGTPRDFTGMPRTLQSLMGEKGLVLFFFRSADWCPFCQAQMMDLNTAVAGMESRGYKLAGISYDMPEIQKTFIERRMIHYTLLSDPKSEIIDRYKLRDPQYPPGNLAYGVPRPIIFILDRNGMIRSKLYEESYKVRPPVTAIVSKLDELARGS